MLAARQRGRSWCSRLLTAVALLGGLFANPEGPRGLGVRPAGATIVGVVATLFAALYPDVMPSTTDPAYSLTIANASSTPYTLTS